MPRSRSRSMPSSTWSDISLLDSAPVSSMIRSDRVVLPWSMWAMMQKFRMSLASMGPRSEVEGGVGVQRQVGDRAPLEQAPPDLGDHGGVVGRERRAHGEAFDRRLPRLLGEAGAQKRVAGDAPGQADRAGLLPARQDHGAIH